MIMSIMTVTATEKADTLRVDNTKIERVVENKTTSANGRVTTHYYLIYNKELVRTSKNVVEKMMLCKKYNAHLALAIVIKGNNKRIILD